MIRNNLKHELENLVKGTVDITQVNGEIYNIFISTNDYCFNTLFYTMICLDDYNDVDLKIIANHIITKYKDTIFSHLFH